MSIPKRFLLSALAWTAVVLVPMAILELTAGSAKLVEFPQWLARAVTFAAFPAGIAASRLAVPGQRPFRTVLELVLAGAVLALVALVLVAWVAPLTGDERVNLARWAELMGREGEWETMNDAAWRYYTTLLVPVQAMLYGAIGFQAAIWAGPAVTPAFRRGLFWAIGLGLLVTGFKVSDSTYESIVLHTANDVSFAAFYAMLIPLGITAGLALPTLAWLRGSVRVGSAP